MRYRYRHRHKQRGKSKNDGERNHHQYAVGEAVIGDADRKGVKNEMKAGSNRVTVAQAAEELGIPAQALRERMKRKVGEIATIGEVLPPLHGKNHLCYVIYRDRLDRYLGKTKAEGSG